MRRSLDRWFDEGYLNDVRLRFYAITLKRKITHPAVMTITQVAKEGLLANAGVPSEV